MFQVLKQTNNYEILIICIVAPKKLGNSSLLGSRQYSGTHVFDKPQLSLLTRSSKVAYEIGRRMPNEFPYT